MANIPNYLSLPSRGNLRARALSNVRHTTVRGTCHACCSGHARIACLSCVRGLASVIGLVLHIAVVPGLLEHVAGEKCLEGIVAALTRLTPAIHGYVIRDGEMLSGLIRSSKPDVVQKAEEEQQLRQRAVLLSLLNAWKV